MRFSRLALAAALALALGAGCHQPTRPGVGPIVGTVRYLNGATVYRAKVEIVGQGSTFTDRLGRYQLPVRGMPGETLTVSGSDGFTPGVVYAETHSGSARVILRPGPLLQDLVLDHAQPI